MTTSELRLRHILEELRHFYSDVIADSTFVLRFAF